MFFRTDQIIEIFESPPTRQNGIGVIDIENQEYQFCDHNGRRYLGVAAEKSLSCGTKMHPAEGFDEPTRRNHWRTESWIKGEAPYRGTVRKVRLSGFRPISDAKSNR